MQNAWREKMDVASLDLASIDHALTTTRAVRKRLDLTRPVEPALLEQCLAIALQAPMGLAGETRHFVVVTDPDSRAAIAALYRRAAAEARSGTRPFDPYLAKLQIPDAADPRFAPQQRMFASGAHLVEHLHEVPVLVLACIEGRVEHAGAGAQASLYASIMHAVLSLILVLRSRVLWSVLTTIHILPFEQDVAQLLGIPVEITQAALLGVAYFTGTDFKPARRAPVKERTHWNYW